MDLDPLYAGVAPEPPLLTDRELSRSLHDQGDRFVDGRRIGACTKPPSSVGAKIAARQAILDADRGGTVDVAARDGLHALARQAGVVTPYSSMICLVDEAQRQRLRELEAQRDRFDREVESGAEASPAAFDISGVPEPADVVLVVVGACAVVVVGRRRRVA